MTITANIGPHLQFPFDLLPGGWLVIAGPPEIRRPVVAGLREAATGTEPLWRKAPVFIGPFDDDDGSRGHDLAVRAALRAGRFVLSEARDLAALGLDPGPAVPGRLAGSEHEPLPQLVYSLTLRQQPRASWHGYPTVAVAPVGVTREELFLDLFRQLRSTASMADASGGLAQTDERDRGTVARLCLGRCVGR